MPKKKGDGDMRARKQTLKFRNRPYIISAYAIGGKKEGEGPLHDWFDECLSDDTYGENTWEKSESRMLKTAMTECMRRGGKTTEEIGAVLSGDLLNQLMSSSFMARDLQIPFLGMYGACSTMTESLMLGAVLTDGGYSDNVMIGASSHYCTAERQFRFPLELGNQRTPTAQWTVTGSGAAIITQSGMGPYITHITPGKIIDMGIKDANNMGAAMAPAFCETLITHFLDTGRSPNYYDSIISGDLGHVGKEIAIDIAKARGYNIKPNYNDCGVLIFDKEKQDTHSGGSGCGCCGSVFSGYFFKQLKAKKLKKVLLIATGALMNSTSSQQGESIPGIAHAISIEI